MERQKKSDIVTLAAIRLPKRRAETIKTIVGALLALVVLPAIGVWILTRIWGW